VSIKSIVVVIDEMRGIGLNNNLLCHLPADLRHFKELTMGKPIIMGHNTFKSIGRPLPGRMNIVLSRQKLQIAGVSVVSSLSEAFNITDVHDEVMIIGGAQIFKESFKHITRIYLSVIHHVFLADSYFPDFDKEKFLRKKIGHSEVDAKNNYAVTFYQYDLK
jgi:dihydrofolate reductase